jgi:hypothetical protein
MRRDVIGGPTHDVLKPLATAQACLAPLKVHATSPRSSLEVTVPAIR